MSPSEWLENASRNGSNQISDLNRSLLLRLATYDEETLWNLLVLLSACFNDLASAGHVNSLPPSMDPAMAAHIFTRCSNIMDDAAVRLSGSGSGSSDSLGSQPSIPQEGL